MVLISHPRKQATPHEKKRHAGHHKPTKRYHKTYWPYMTMLAVVLCGFLFSNFWTQGRQVLGYATDLTVPALLQYTNLARHEHAMRPLTLNDQLSRAAQAKANDMAKRDYWSHISPDGKQPWHFVQQSGYRYSVVGENLAYGFDGSAATVNAWLSSPEHKANVLSTDYREVGFGIANAADFQGKGPETVVVALYGSPESAAATATNTGSVESSGNVLPMRNVSRLETVSPTHAALLAVTTAVVAAGSTLFVALKHGFILRRTLVKGEAFVVRHHLLDFLLLAVGAVGFVVTRSAGIVH